MTSSWLILGGLIALYFGAEWLVRGAASLAVRLGLTPLMVGLTVVAYGTSSPELVVSLMAAQDGNGAIAIGNVVGSNIFNIGFILGLTAMVCPLRVQFQLLRVDTPIMIGVAAVLLAAFRDFRIEVWEAWLFLGGIAGYTAFNVWLARKSATPEVRKEFDAEVPTTSGGVWRDALFVAAGLAILVVGSRLFVNGSVQIARMLGVSDAIIGLTIVAAGTSLPELASSLMAAARKHPDIAIGNVVGSNIYNILAILGVGGTLAGPLEAEGVSRADLWAMLGISVLLLPIAASGSRLGRREGVLLLAVYGAYLWRLWPK